MCKIGAKSGRFGVIADVLAAFFAVLLAGFCTTLSSRNALRECEGRYLSRLSESNRRPIHYE